MGAGYGPAGLSASDAWDPAPNPFEGVRFIDPRVKDYVLASDGTFQRMTETKQRVMLALITLRDSANGLPGFGVEFPDALDQHFERRARLAVQTALMHLENVIDITNIMVETEGGSAGRARITVEWRDLSTDESDRFRF